MDSLGCPRGWSDLDEITPKPLVILSVGWLYHQDEECNVIVPHLGEKHPDAIENQGCGHMVIPTKAIVSTTELSIPPPPQHEISQDRIKPLSETSAGTCVK